MKQITTFIVAAVFAAIVAGCATPPRSVVPQPSSDQKLEYDQGEAILYSSKEKFDVSISYYRGQGSNGSSDKTSFTVAVKNKTDNPVTVTTGNIGVYFNSSNKRWNDRNPPNFAVYSRDDLINEINAVERSAKIQAGIAAGLVATAAVASAYQTTTTTAHHNGSVWSPRGGSAFYSGSSTYKTSTYNPTAAVVGVSAAAGGYYLAHGSIEQKANAARAMVNDLVFQSHTVQPGEVHAGIVASDSRSLKYNILGQYQVLVSVEGEEHIFTFTRS